MTLPYTSMSHNYTKPLLFKICGIIFHMFNLAILILMNFSFKIDLKAYV